MMVEPQVQRDALFCEFSLERHVPEKQLLRAIDHVVDLDGIRRCSTPTGSSPQSAATATLRARKGITESGFTWG